MSLTLTLTGDTSVLTANYFPPIELATDYVCGLIDFQTYNSIPNIDTGNNIFFVGDTSIEIPVGSYEINDIAKIVESELVKSDKKANISIKANNNTLQCVIKSNRLIDFEKDRSVGSLLGFSARKLPANIEHISDLPINIIKVNAIRIECNITSASYINSRKSHSIHHLSVKVPPGYKIVDTPSEIIYLPVNVRQISTLIVELLDQDGYLINFRGETITLRLHLKPQ